MSRYRDANPVPTSPLVAIGAVFSLTCMQRGEPFETAMISMVLQSHFLTNRRHTKTKKRYLRVYIHQWFRHACHETKDRQSRSIVSGQEEGWGVGNLGAIEILNTIEKHEWTIKKKKIVCSSLNLKKFVSNFDGLSKEWVSDYLLKKISNNKLWTLFRKVLKSD